MIKSMTGFSKKEAKEKGVTASVEIKSLNGRYLELKCRMPKQHTYKELEVRELVKSFLTRGNVQLQINVATDDLAAAFSMNEDAALACYEGLKNLKKRLKIRDAIKLEHVLHFSQSFTATEDDENEALEWKLIKNSLREALKSLDKMRVKEGQQLLKDFQARIKKIAKSVGIIEEMGIKRIPEEREKLRQRVARLFESDEIDEQRLQLELVLLADKLDISEECVRLRSHIKFFNEALKNSKPIGKKLNFLLQEMHREINTIGSKANDAEISNNVIDVKEELERIREQVQNIE